MSTLKSMYFYFLAAKISFIKSIKKIYYSTDVYNKSLISKTPQQFFYNPNPFLLNLITNSKNNLFKISDVDLNTEWFFIIMDFNHTGHFVTIAVLIYKKINYVY